MFDIDDGPLLRALLDKCMQNDSVDDLAAITIRDRVNAFCVDIGYDNWVDAYHTFN